MRIADGILDPEEENATETAMYSILKDEFQWTWPDATKHLSSWKDDCGELIKHEDENDKGFDDRAARWDNWPSLKTTQQAQWLRCATITSRALTYLQTCHTRGLKLTGTSPSGYRYDFMPQSFYEYIWICLSQGLGTSVWKTQPPMPSEQVEDKGMWFESNANRLVKETVEKWEQGNGLDSLIPRFTLDDLFPSPECLETIALVRAKTSKSRLKRLESNRQIPRCNSIQPLPEDQDNGGSRGKQETKRTISKTRGTKVKRIKQKDGWLENLVIRMKKKEN